MPKARRTEGPRAPLFYGALAIAFGGSVHAQTVDLSDLEICAGLESPELKLTCFEAIVATGRGSAEPVAEAVHEVAEPVASEPSEPPVAAPASFGSEHLAREDPETPEILEATVAEVTRDRYGALIFHLDNGQVWRQTEPRYFPYPKSGEFDVEISTGMMGEYRLQVGGAGRKVRIRRLQ